MPGGALPAAAIAGVFAARRRHPGFALGLAWFFLAMLPVSNLVFAMGTIRAERVLYLPSVGACLIASEAFALIAARRRRLATTLAAVLLASLAVVAMRRNLVWRDQGTLLASIVVDAPRSARGHYMLANHYMAAGDCVSAAAGYRRALQMRDRAGRFALRPLQPRGVAASPGPPSGGAGAIRGGRARRLE